MQREKTARARSAGLPVALAASMLPAAMFDACTTMTRSGDTAIFTHAWWTGPAFVVAAVAGIVWSARLWRQGAKVRAVTFATICVALAVVLVPKHVMETISVSSRGVESRQSTWWWQPEIWRADFSDYSEAIVEERRELKSNKGTPELLVHRTLTLVPKAQAGNASPLISVSINGLLRDSGAIADILRRAREAGLETDAAKSPHLARQKEVQDTLRKKFGLP